MLRLETGRFFVEGVFRRLGGFRLGEGHCTPFVLDMHKGKCSFVAMERASLSSIPFNGRFPARVEYMTAVLFFVLHTPVKITRYIKFS